MRALIIGVSGQDGAYLAELLLAKGYEVIGTARDANISTFGNLARLGIRDRVRTLSMAPNDFRSVLTALVQVEPDEVYNLSGQSSVGLSFEQPVETMESISIATLNILEAIRFTKRAASGSTTPAPASASATPGGGRRTRRRRSGRAARTPSRRRRRTSRSRTTARPTGCSRAAGSSSTTSRR